MVIKRDSNGKRYYILPLCNMTCLNLLLVFAVSFTPEMPNFGTFGRIAHPLRNFHIFSNFYFLTVDIHIYET